MSDKKESPAPQKIGKLKKLLEGKTRELEIEKALEKVRVVATAMKQPADMLKICRIISLQLQSLGVKEIRNVQTAIFYPQRSAYMNYEYYAKHKKTFVTETTYNNNKIHNAFAKKMLKGKGEFYISHIKGKKVKEWIKYQKSTNVFIDKFLEKASSLNYYWYSLGPVALGISTYVPLTDEETNLFKRFLKVFELSYRRYLDIEKAEAQAREAEIELALERVRARTMAMQKSNELHETTLLLFKQFKSLGEIASQVSIAIFDNEINNVELYITLKGDKIDRSFTIEIENDPFVWSKASKAFLQGEKLFIKTFTGQELQQYNHWRNKEAGSNLYDESENSLAQTWNMYAAFFSKGAIIFSTNKTVPDETIKLLERFGKVFEQTYTRFLDLQKAEAQARESQIQLALERVRARTMAMQKSDELSETVFILFQQFKQLGENPDQATIGIINEEEWVIEYWVTMYGNQTNRVYKFPIDEPNVTNKIYNSWKEQKRSLVIELSGKELYDFATFRESMGGAAYNPEEKKRVINVAFFSKGIINVQSNESRSGESVRLLERFAGVFEQTYTRFLDLQKAEAQSREAQIQLALERVRVKTMAMHDSEDVTAATETMFDELQKLGINNLRGGITNILPEKTMEVFGITNMSDGKTMKGFTLFDMNAHPLWQRLFKSWNNKEEVFIDYLAGKEKQDYINVVNTRQNYLPQSISEFPDTHFQTYRFDQGAIWTYSLEPHNEAEKEIMKRFASGFALTFRRYQDLQKAEAQAREGQIEAALERVRSRSIGMQKSDELKDVIQI